VGVCLVGLDVFKLVPDTAVVGFPFTAILVETHNLLDGVRVLLLLFLGDAALLEHTLPFWR
jgi:hypothetical protein